jgi:xylulokinase
MALWNPRTGDWSEEVVAAIDPGLGSKLPPVLPADATIGDISPILVRRFGFSPQCRIDAGSGDNMYAALGTGNFKPGLVTVSLGTSGTACTILDEPLIDPTGQVASYCDSTGRYLPLLCVSNLANGYNSLLREFDLNHVEFDRLIEQTSPGNRGRLLIPWYEGERTPDLPVASPTYFGFGLADFTPTILARAVLEGHILNLYDGYLKLNIQPMEIRLTGGLTRSSAWCQGIADIFSVEAVPVKGEGAALGAAIHAAWAWAKENGLPVSLEDLTSQFVRLDESRRTAPRSGHQKDLDRLRRLYGAVSRRIRGLESPDPFVIQAELRG